VAIEGLKLVAIERLKLVAIERLESWDIRLKPTFISIRDPLAKASGN